MTSHRGPGPRSDVDDGPKVVALGGGHGLYASLSALRRVTARLTAVVTVADDGGSSGRLRAELGVLPPGDLRMALAALCGDDEWGRTWSEVVQHRFRSEGDLHGHAVGNLLIVGAVGAARRPGRRRSTGSAGCSARTAGCCRWPRCRSTSTPRCEAATRRPVDARCAARSPCALTAGPGRRPSRWSRPTRPPARGGRRRCWTPTGSIFGPGSWFTSVLPHLLVPELADGAAQHPRAPAGGAEPGAAGRARPTASPRRRTWRCCGEHAPGLRLDVVLADTGVVDDPDELDKAAAELGARLVAAPTVAAERRHPAA